MADEPLLEAREIRKEFPGVLALDNVSLRLGAGTVHAVMGENGAGKSTLMRVIAGIEPPDRGILRLHGREVRLQSPLAALRHGIAMIHQELNLMGSMTVAENIWIRREPTTRLGLVDHGALRRRTTELFQELAINLDPEAEVGDLPVAARQLVEIARAVSYDAEVLIMDEPTSALTDREVHHLFGIIRGLKAKGKAIVYITHKMDEVFAIADEVTVLRDGRHIGTEAASSVTRDRLIRMMVGRDLTQLFPARQPPTGNIVLSVRDLGLEGRFRDVSFDLHAGEILGIAGLVGSGRSNVAEALFGVTPATTGTIAIRGRPVAMASPRDAMRHGMAFLTEDRKETGCFASLDVGLNMATAVLTRQFVRAGFVTERLLDEACTAMGARLRVKTPASTNRCATCPAGTSRRCCWGGGCSPRRRC